MRMKRGLQLPGRANRQLRHECCRVERRTLVDGNKVGRSERCGIARAGEVRFDAVQMLVGLLNGNRARNVVGVDADALLRRDALTGRVRRLRDSGTIAVVIGGGRSCPRITREMRGWRLLIVRLLLVPDSSTGMLRLPLGREVRRLLASLLEFGW